MNNRKRKIHITDRLVHEAAPINEQAAVLEHVNIELQSNSIDNFDTLKSDLRSILQLDDWEVICSGSNLHIYKLIVEPNGNLKIQTSIMVDSDLVLKIFHRDKLLGLKFSNQTIHRSLKLKEWSHLQKLIDKFSNGQELTIHSERIRYE